MSPSAMMFSSHVPACHFVCAATSTCFSSCSSASSVPTDVGFATCTVAQVEEAEGWAAPVKSLPWMASPPPWSQRSSREAPRAMQEGLQSEIVSYMCEAPMLDRLPRTSRLLGYSTASSRGLAAMTAF